MDINQITKLLDGYKPEPIDDYYKYSVMVPLIEIDGELHLIYEVRSMTINRQPGEISFPGGKIEEGETRLEAAIRETCEEIGINKENINIITELDYLPNHNQSSFVFSFLGHVKNIDISNIKYNEAEVSELFYVPLSFFLENEPRKSYVNFYGEVDEDFPVHMVNNGDGYNWGNFRNPVYFYNYKDYIIWGLTAKITYSFINKIKNFNEIKPCY